ncbi:MAG: hypothetical protein EOP09_05515 [Proteobacteria bacterium]|nr:MAG: hypothetical protein EOP09_05515 [Pseudomonadota bacterium]
MSKILSALVFTAVTLSTSCTKIKNEDIPSRRVTSALVSGSSQTLLAGYSPQIDLMVAFLWPVSVSGPSGHQALVDIITTSRTLQSQKSEFLKKRAALKIEYVASECACLLDGICSGAEQKTDLDLCVDIEDRTAAHDRSLAQIYTLASTIQTRVTEIGGTWIETNQDFPGAPRSQFNPLRPGLTLNVFGKSDGVALSYEPILPIITQQSGFELYRFEFASKVLPQSKFKIMVTPIQDEHSLLLQGELFLLDQNDQILRQGFIYWEQLKN